MVLKKLGSVEVLWQVAGVCYIDTYFIALILIGAHLFCFGLFMFLLTILGVLNITASHCLSGSAKLASWREVYLCGAGSCVEHLRVKYLEFAPDSLAPFLPTCSSLQYTTVLTSIHRLFEKLMHSKTNIKLCLIWRLEFYLATFEYQLSIRYWERNNIVEG